MLRMKISMKKVVAALLLMPIAFAVAETKDELAVRKLVVPRLGPGAKVDSVTKTPMQVCLKYVLVAILFILIKKPNICFLVML